MRTHKCTDCLAEYVCELPLCSYDTIPSRDCKLCTPDTDGKALELLDEFDKWVRDVREGRIETKSE